MRPPSEARPDSPFAQRYEMLIRVSQAIKAHRGCGELFQALAAELRKVVEFEAIYNRPPTSHRPRQQQVRKIAASD